MTKTLEKPIAVEERGIRETDGRFFVDGVDVTAITQIVEPDFISVMGKVGRKSFHLYALKKAGKWSALHGVTSILKETIAKPFLIGWAANMACDYIQERLKTADDVLGSLPNWLEEARTAHIDIRDDAGNKGKLVHKEVERLINLAVKERDGFILPEDTVMNGQITEFINWAKEGKVRFLESEKPVVSRESHYAGTLDIILEVEGKKYLGDVKTGKGIYPEYFLQMAAYQGALEEMGQHTDIQGSVVINLPKAGGLAIGYNYDYSGNRLAFLAALTLYKQLQSLN